MSNKRLNKLLLDSADAVSYNVESANDYFEEEAINIDKYLARGLKEIKSSKKTKFKKELTKSQSFFMRAVLAAKIVHECHTEWAFGVIKFQKLVYLSEQVCDMKFTSDYRKQAAGPMDHKFIHSIKREFEKQKWFDVKQVGKYNKWVFTPSENILGYEKYYDRYYGNVSDGIQFLIDTFRKRKTDQVELVATIFGCLLEAKKENSIISDKLIIQKVYAWNKSKKKFSEKDIVNGLRWMEENKIYPK